MHIYQLIFKSIDWTEWDENKLYTQVKRDELTMCWILPLCFCKVDGCLSASATPLSILLISCALIRTSLHSCIILGAPTSTRLILQVYPQPSGAEFRQNCLDLDKWGRKVEGAQDKRDDSFLPVLSQKWRSLLSFLCQSVPKCDHKVTKYAA